MQVMDDHSLHSLSSTKVDSLQRNLAMLNKAYLEQIRNLKELLRQKTVKQTALKLQVQELKNECSQHNEEIKGMLAKTMSPVKSVKSHSNKSDTSISISFKKNKITDNKLKLNINSLTNMQSKGMKMNSPRSRMLNMQLACENIEEKLKNSHNNMVKNQKKTNNSSNFVQLNKQGTSGEKSSRYSYQFQTSSSSSSLRSKKYLVKSIGFEKKGNPEEKSLQNKQFL